MRVYYLNQEYETGKHKIVIVWSDVSKSSRPEDDGENTIGLPYSVIELEERYNRKSCALLSGNDRMIHSLPDRFYVNNSGEIVNTDTGQTVSVNPNPQKESYKLSQLYGLTQQQLQNYIDNNVTNLAEAKTFIKKLSAVVLWLVKQTRLDE